MDKNFATKEVEHYYLFPTNIAGNDTKHNKTDF
jgi:hypothetical protein